MISVVFPRLILRELSLMGVASEGIWPGTGLVADDLWERTHIEQSAFQTLLLNALRISDDPAFGLRFGQHSLAQLGGEDGIAVMSAPTLLAGLQTSTNFSRLRASYVEACMHPVDVAGRTYIRLSAREIFDMGETRRTQLEVFALTFQNSVEVALGCPLGEGKVSFNYPEPTYASRYEEVFHVPVEFEAAFSGIEIPMELGACRLPTYDQRLWDLAVQRCNKLMNAASSPTFPLYSERVREQLQIVALPLPDVASVAAALGLSERNLHRRLRLEGVNFRQLRSQVLFERAQSLLLGTDTVEMIAERLGYSDPANFRRAFRSWSGQSPAAYRNI